MQYTCATSKEHLEQADILLYQELWHPYGLPRDTRSQFEVNGDEYVFIALDENIVIGVVVLIIESKHAEIRHAAIGKEYQRTGIGKGLVEYAIKFAEAKEVNDFEVYGRNSAIGFWEILGFKDKSGWLDHEVFIKYGIRFKKMIKLL